jgi:RuvB C-terminal winged helix domain
MVGASMTLDQRNREENLPMKRGSQFPAQTKQTRGLIRSLNRSAVRNTKGPQVALKTARVREPNVCARCGVVFLRSGLAIVAGVANLNEIGAGATRSSVIDKFDGGPVGVETLAAAVGEEADTIGDVYEPYLMQEGFIARKARGRIATQPAYTHLGRTRCGTLL